MRAFSTLFIAAALALSGKLKTEVWGFINLSNACIKFSQRRFG